VTCIIREGDFGWDDAEFNERIQPLIDLNQMSSLDPDGDDSSG
jgi:hypothetical protein